MNTALGPACVNYNSSSGKTFERIEKLKRELRPSGQRMRPDPAAFHSTAAGEISELWLARLKWIDEGFECVGEVMGFTRSER